MNDNKGTLCTMECGEGDDTALAPSPLLLFRSWHCHPCQSFCQSVSPGPWQFSIRMRNRSAEGIDEVGELTATGSKNGQLIRCRAAGSSARGALGCAIQRWEGRRARLLSSGSDVGPQVAATGELYSAVAAKRPGVVLGLPPPVLRGS